MLVQLPDEKNSITLDPLVRDYFGSPAPRIAYSIGNYEKETAKRAVDIIEKIFDVLEAEIIDGGSKVIKDISTCAHHMGTCRMGNDPERSVVDPNLKARDIDNLFIVGSSVFVTGGGVNPSLTIAALAIRAAEYILKEVR
jgi:glucose dehydrogenase